MWWSFLFYTIHYFFHFLEIFVIFENVVFFVKFTSFLIYSFPFRFQLGALLYYLLCCWYVNFSFYDIFTLCFCFLTIHLLLLLFLYISHQVFFVEISTFLSILITIVFLFDGLFLSFPRYMYWCYYFATKHITAFRAVKLNQFRSIF